MTRPRRVRSIAASAIALIGSLAVTAPAAALSFRAEFSDSGYQVQAGDTWADLLAAHQAGAPLASVDLTALEDVSAQVEAGVDGDYSILMTADLDVAVAGQYEFQVGADWGRGGVAALLDDSGTVLDQLVRTDDIWWNDDWNDGDVFSTVVNLTAGSSYSLAWLGFEDCCGGVTTIRFSHEGGAFEPLDTPSIAPYLAIPEPGAAILLGVGLGGLAVGRRSSRRPERS